jgi:hypothetical protein
MNHFAGTHDAKTDDKQQDMRPEDKKALRTQDDVLDAGRRDDADPAQGPTPVKFREPSRQADAPQNYADSSYPRYVFRKGTGRVQGDTGVFTAESMIVHRPEEFQSLIDSGIWCRSPAEAGEMSKEDKEKQGIR